MAKISSGTDWWETESLIPFQPCSSMVVSGSSGSGKTTWVYRLLQNLNLIYLDGPKSVLYCYGIHQDKFDDMERELDNISFHKGIPSKEEIDEFTSSNTHNLIILDDLMDQVTQNIDMLLLFTQGCHHRKLSVIYITQNLYQQNKYARTMSLNTWYLILFRNLRDASQIQTLGRQIFPNKPKLLVEAYQDCMKTPFNYLVIDMSPCGEEQYRLRTKIFPNEDTVIYQ